MLWLSVCLCVCSALHPDTLPTHSSLKRTYMHPRRYICVCVPACPPVCLFVCDSVYKTNRFPGACSRQTDFLLSISLLTRALDEQRETTRLKLFCCAEVVISHGLCSVLICGSSLFSVHCVPTVWNCSYSPLIVFLLCGIVVYSPLIVFCTVWNCYFPLY